MGFLDRLAAGLAWLGRHGTNAVAISILLGIALPPLGALIRPFFPETVFLLLCLAFLRVDPGALRAQFAKPQLLLAATIWTMLIVPVLIGAAWRARPLDRSPGAAAGADAQCGCAADLLVAGARRADGAERRGHACAAARLHRRDAISRAGAGRTVRRTGGDVLAAGAWPPPRADAGRRGCSAIAVRSIAGKPWVERQAERIDGLNVIVLFLFAVALMGDVAANAIAIRCSCWACWRFDRGHVRAERADRAAVRPRRLQARCRSRMRQARATPA